MQCSMAMGQRGIVRLCSTAKIDNKIYIGSANQLKPYNEFSFQQTFHFISFHCLGMLSDFEFYEMF